MSPPEVWGPAVWTLFHTLTERVSEHAYPFISAQLFSQIVRICKFLPCPECSLDATNFLAKVNISNLKTKTEFKNLFYLFHNYVNAKKRKPLFNYEKINMYASYPLIPVLNNFNSKYNTKGNMNLISDSFQRNLLQTNFKKWIVANIGAFVPPPLLRLPIANPITEVEEPITNPIVTEVEELPITEEELPITEDNISLISDSLQKKSLQTNFKSWIDANIGDFVPSPLLEDPIVEDEESAGEEPIVPEEQVNQKSNKNKKSKKTKK